MKRRFLNLFLVLALVVCVLPFATSAAECEHDYVNKGYRKGDEPTCVANGISVLECSICKATTAQTAYALGHDFTGTETVTKTATCARTGTKTIQCTRCDETEEKTIAKLPHEYVDVEEKPATCVKEGKTAGKQCSSCKRVQNGMKTIPATGKHNYELVEYVAGSEPTCTQNGIGVFKCADCGDPENITVNKLGHIKDITVIKEATCTVDGLQCFVCEREGCSQYEFEVISAPGHTEEIVPAVDATCTSTGLTEGKKCSVCGETLLAQVVTDKAAHEFTVNVDRLEATCTADGYTAHKKCANCDATEGKEELDTDGHIFENYICKVCGTRDGSCEHENRIMTYVAPTCSDEGSQSMRCPDCKYETTEILETIPHTPKDLSVEPTCSTAGKKHVICAVCNVNIEGPTVIGATNNHNGVGGICTVCGASVCDHNDTTTNTTESTCTAAGKRTETCDSCGKVLVDERLPLAAHNHVNGICSVCGHKDSNRLTSDYQDVHVVGGSAY